MAPEIIENGVYDYKSDLWSVGCILYLMLTGIPPFNGIEDSEIIAKVMRGKYYKDAIVRKGYSQEALDFINNLICPLEDRMNVD